MTMKTMMVNVGLLSVLLAVGCGCQPHGGDVLGANAAVMSPDAIVGKASEPDTLGWVKYNGGGWSEAYPEHAKNVVILGLKKVGACAEKHVCFERSVISSVRERGARISDSDLGPLADQYSLGRASGVIVRHGGDLFIVTTAHGEELGAYAVRGYTVGQDSWARGETLQVPASNVMKCDFKDVGGTECEEGAIRVCKLDNDAKYDGLGLSLAEPSVPLAKVRAVMHPLGLPMKQSNWVSAVHPQGACMRAPFDNATGGSGGAVISEDGGLAGTIVGSGVRIRIEEGVVLPRDCEMREKPPGKNDSSCDYGQAFMRADVIRKLLDSVIHAGR